MKLFRPNWDRHPIVIIIGIIASCVAIFTFITGIENVKQLLLPISDHQSTPTKTTLIKIDGLASDWIGIDCTEILDEESDMVSTSDPQAAKGIDFKRICYKIQDAKFYILMEFYGEINQYDSGTKAYVLSFSNKPDPKPSDSYTYLELWYVPSVGAELSSHGDNKFQLLPSQDVNAAYDRNFIEIEIALEVIQRTFSSSPYLNYLSTSSINEQCEGNDRLVCSFLPGGDSGQYTLVPLSVYSP